MNEFLEKYRKQKTEALAKAGFNVKNLTQAQIDIIEEPNEAPENYACDGEISPREARVRWIDKLRKAGLSQVDVQKAIKYVFGK